METTIKKDGKAYDSGDVVITLLGNIANEVSEIVYNTEQAHQLNYGLGNKPTSWSMGKEEPTASITMSMKEVVAIENAAGGNLLKIKPFDINVSFVNEYNVIVNDTLTVKFKNQGRDVNGEMGLMKQFELFTLDIDYNNV